MKNDPLISVIMPSYNQGKFIEESIQSVLNQSYLNYEFIIIDGNSTDGTTGIIQKYDSKLTFWCSEKDNGQTDALIKGFKRAKGQIFYWLCSDDIVLPGVFEEVANCFKKNPNLDFVYGDTIYIYPDNSRNYKPRIKYHYKTMLWGFNIIAQPSCFFSKQIYIKSGGLNPKLNYAMDYDLFLRFGEKPKYLQIKKPMSLYRIHPTSKTVNDLKKFLREWQFIRTSITGTPSGLRHKFLWIIYNIRVIYRFFLERGIIKFLPDKKKYSYQKFENLNS